MSIPSDETTSKPSDEVTLKQLKIRAGTLRRNLKDHLYYQKELQVEQKRLEKFISEDDSKQKQQRGVIEETKAVIPDVYDRLIGAIADVKKFLSESSDSLNSEEELVVETNALIANAEATAEAHKTALADAMP